MIERYCTKCKLEILREGDVATLYGGKKFCECGDGEVMNEAIHFNEWSKERIETHNKICTSRHKRYTRDKRVIWISPLLPWWFIRTFLYGAEGANSGKELQEVIESIYKRKVPDNEQFYVHFGDFKSKVKDGNEK